jgi:hypothetical protein
MDPIGVSPMGGRTMHTSRHEPYTLTPGAAGIRPLARSWWMLLLRGVVSILFGIAAFVWPGLTVLALTLLYGAFAMADGILSLGAALRGTGDRSIPTWWLVVIGLLGIAAGAVAFLWPGLTAGPGRWPWECWRSSAPSGCGMRSRTSGF